VEALNRPEEEEIEPSSVLTLPAIWLPDDLVPFPGEGYELALDVAVRRAIATALVDHDLLVLVPARHRGIGVVAHLDELKRSRSGNGGIQLGVTCTSRARLLGETAVDAPLLTVLVLEQEPQDADALEESMPELQQLLHRYLEHLRLHRGGDLLDDMDRAAGASDQWSGRSRLRLLSTTDPERRARVMARLIRASLPRLRYDRVLSQPPAPAAEATSDLRQVLKESGLEQSAAEHIITGLKGARQEVLDLAASLPWGKEAPLNPNAAGTRAILDARHFGAEEVKERVTELVTVHLESRRLGRGTGPGLRVLLVGPPGTGKSTIASSIAEALGVPFEQIRLGGVAEAFSLQGAHPFYSQSGPGRLLEAVRRAGVKNPLVLLDELGGMTAAFNGDPQAAIMAAVDPALSRSYVDSFLGVPFDLSQVTWVGTTNETTSLSPALLDRFDLLELAGYGPDERLQIARELLLPKAIAASPFAEGVTVEIEEEALVLLATEYERGPGVRRLESALTRVLRRAVMEQARGCRHIRIGPDRLRQWLGAPHAATRVGFRPR
jgi:hypothetical protein